MRAVLLKGERADKKSDIHHLPKRLESLPPSIHPKPIRNPSFLPTPIDILERDPATLLQGLRINDASLPFTT
jgi:hypothetical protein